MNARALLSAILLELVVTAFAAEAPPKTGISTSSNSRTEWNTNPAYWERVLTEKHDSPGLRVGKSSWVVQGPIIERMRRQRPSGGRSAGERLLGLPIVRLLVPQPTPPPPGGGKYLRWGESDRPWVVIAQGAAPGGSSGNPVTHEARSSLISFGR